MTVNIVKSLISALFFLCLLDMPYGYFQLVRFVALLGFIILSYYANQQNKRAEMFIYIGLAILFQPLIKISLGRKIWNIVDVVVGVGLIASIFIKPKDSKKNQNERNN